MSPSRHSRSRFPGDLGLMLLLSAMVLATVARSDVLIGTNDERFVGKVIEETPDTIVFESDLGGRMMIPRARVRELQRTPPPVTSPVTDWKPPGIGKDGCDWVQLKSGEWLKGWLRYLQDKTLDFESEKLDEMTIKLKDVQALYTAKPVNAKFENRKPINGLVVLSNDVVYVGSEKPVQLLRADLLGITPGGQQGMKYWTGKLSIGLNLRAGNTKSTDLNLSGELDRRTPNTELQLTYLGNYASVDDAESENNQRVNGLYDIRLDRHFFVRPVWAEYYRDPLANISHRATIGVAAGYYFFDTETAKWYVAAGPSFQYTQFETVETNQSDSASTPVALLSSVYEAELTARLKTELSYTGYWASREAGLYSHHALWSFEFEIKRHLTLDLQFIWDYLQNPATESDGTLPQRSDFRLNLGLGVRF